MCEFIMSSKKWAIYGIYWHETLCCIFRNWKSEITPGNSMTNMNHTLSKHCPSSNYFQELVMSLREKEIKPLALEILKGNHQRQHLKGINLHLFVTTNSHTVKYCLCALNLSMLFCSAPRGELILDIFRLIILTWMFLLWFGAEKGQVTRTSCKDWLKLSERGLQGR